MAVISLHQVTKRYGDREAVVGVDLELNAETTTAIVGPSGGGKSTLLQLINGLVTPDVGTVRVFGDIVSRGDLVHLRRKIGYAVQGTGLFPHMRVWDNITLLARLEGWGVERTRTRAYELMSLVNIPREFERRYPHELSGGQQQRVGLCRAMMLNPPIFLLDEPFGALDPITRGEIQREFIDLQQAEPRTIVLVTHDLREAFRLATRVVILDEGRIIQDADSETLRTRPASAFVSRLIHDQLSDGGNR